MAETDYMVEVGHRVPNELQRVERRRIILQLRRAGLQGDEIVAALRNLDPPIIMSKQAVSRTIQRYLDAVNAEDAETASQLRVLENQRLDSLWRRYIRDALQGDIKAASLLIKLSERRAKMNGLDAAIQVQHGGVLQHLHAIGVDMDEVKRAEEAFKTARFGEQIPDVEVVNAEEVAELEAEGQDQSSEEGGSPEEGRLSLTASTPEH
jgi:DNA-binding transcriptional MerR regulator